MLDLLEIALGLIFTVAIFSYLVDDNPFYRLAVHILVGVTAAYATVIAVQNILLPTLARLRDNPIAIDSILWLVPLLLGVLLLFKTVSRLAWLGNSSMAALIGIGAAVALSGAITGTLLPQILYAGDNGFLGTLLVGILTVCTLLYFQFTGRIDRQGQPIPWQQPIAGIGRTVLAITFGALFAGIFSTSLILLTTHLAGLLNGLLDLVGG